VTKFAARTGCHFLGGLFFKGPFVFLFGPFCGGRRRIFHRASEGFPCQRSVAIAVPDALQIQVADLQRFEVREQIFFTRCRLAGIAGLYQRPMTAMKLPWRKASLDNYLAFVRFDFDLRDTTPSCLAWRIEDGCVLQPPGSSGRYVSQVWLSRCRPLKKKQVAYHYSSHLDSHSPIVEL